MNVLEKNEKLNDHLTEMAKTMNEQTRWLREDFLTTIIQFILATVHEQLAAKNPSAPEPKKTNTSKAIPMSETTLEQDHKEDKNDILEMSITEKEKQMFSEPLRKNEFKPDFTRRISPVFKR
jgi:hypothetical protein